MEKLEEAFDPSDEVDTAVKKVVPGLPAQTEVDGSDVREGLKQVAAAAPENLHDNKERKDTAGEKKKRKHSTSEVSSREKKFKTQKTTDVVSLEEAEFVPTLKEVAPNTAKTFSTGEQEVGANIFREIVVPTVVAEGREAADTEAELRDAADKATAEAEAKLKDEADEAATEAS